MSAAGLNKVDLIIGGSVTSGVVKADFNALGAVSADGGERVPVWVAFKARGAGDIETSVDPGSSVEL